MKYDYVTTKWRDIPPNQRIFITQYLTFGEESLFKEAVQVSGYNPRISIAYDGLTPIAWAADFGRKGDGYVRYIVHFYTDENYRQLGIALNLFSRLFPKPPFIRPIRVYEWASSKFFQKLKKAYPNHRIKALWW